MQARAVALNVARIGFALLTVVAMTYQFASIDDRPEFSAGNFFGFFTIQSNILAAVMLVAAALVRPQERGPLFDAVRGGVALSITITGVVFALLLSGTQVDLNTGFEWVDFVVHRLIPVVVVADWLLEPARHRPSSLGRGSVARLPGRLVRLHARAGRGRRLVPVPLRGRCTARVRRRIRQRGDPARRVRGRCARLLEGRQLAGRPPAGVRPREAVSHGAP